MKWLANSILLCFNYFHYPSLATCMNIKMKWLKTTKRKELKTNNKGQTGIRPNSNTCYYENNMIASVINVIVNEIQE